MRARTARHNYSKMGLYSVPLLRPLFKPSHFMVSLSRALIASMTAHKKLEYVWIGEGGPGWNTAGLE